MQLYANQRFALPYTWSYVFFWSDHHCYTSCCFYCLLCVWISNNIFIYPQNNVSPDLTQHFKVNAKSQFTHWPHSCFSHSIEGLRCQGVAWSVRTNDPFKLRFFSTTLQTCRSVRGVKMSIEIAPKLLIFLCKIYSQQHQVLLQPFFENIYFL